MVLILNLKALGSKTSHVQCKRGGHRERGVRIRVHVYLLRSGLHGGGRLGCMSASSRMEGKVDGGTLGSHLPMTLVLRPTPAISDT